MPGNAVHALQGLRSRLASLQRSASRLEASRDHLEEDLLAKREEVERLVKEQGVLVKVIELYRVLMDKMVMGQVQALESVVTEGLQAIFHDQDLSFGIEISAKWNKVSADPYLMQGDVRGHPLESFGGGPASIISLILRVLVLLRLKKYPALFLDESLGAVSDDYVDATGLFLQKLADSSGIPILLVTHKPAFLDHAKVGYQGVKSETEEGPLFTSRRISR